MTTTGHARPSIDTRTRPVGAAGSVDPAQFIAGPWAAAVGRNGARAALDASYLGLPPLAIAIDDDVFTLRERDRVIEAVAGRRDTDFCVTLDPSAFINGPHQGGSYDELFPFVRHVQLRDTGKAPGKFQVRVGQGEVEYGRIISQLQRNRYDRLLSVALHDVAEAPFAMETEVRKLKYLLESLV